MEKVIILDCETTGLSDTDHVIDVCIRKGLEDDAEVTLWRVRPPIPIPEDIAKIHGISDDMVAECPLFGQVADHIAQVIEEADVLIGYNPDYDKNMLIREFEAAGLKVKWPSVTVDAKRLWDIYLPPPKRSLVAAFKEFVDANGYDGAHGAVADVNATVKVIKSQLAKFDLQEKTWAELDPEREKWVGSSSHFVWADSYKEKILVGFGKHHGTELSKLDAGYVKYIIEKDFPTHVKEVCRQLQVIREKRIPQQDKAIALWAKERFQ